MKKLLMPGYELRVRRRETILHPPPGYEFISSVDLDKMPPDHHLSNQSKTKSLIRALKLHFISKNNSKQVDAVYSPGKLMFTMTPWFVEVDNIAVLSYYNLSLLRVLRPFIRWVLSRKSCKGIVCLSEAAKTSFQNYFGDELTKKTSVVYPYIQSVKAAQNSECTFLYVSTDFYLKGGRQILDGFSEEINANLIIVSKQKDISTEDMARIESDSRIKFLEANMSKDELRIKAFQESDVLIHPSFQDSFGMVVLEAVACGMAIISSDLYAFPEMVEDSYNGFLVKLPFYYFDRKTQLPNSSVWKSNIREMARKAPSKKLISQLKTSMLKLSENDELRAQMKLNSKTLFQKKFSPQIRNAAFKKVLSRLD